MKLPFSVGIKLIFRLVLPGFLLTIGLYPALLTLRGKAGWTISVEYLFVFSIIITGWLLLTLDQPVYMFLEGRRFWPRPIRCFFIWTEQRRLKKVKVAEDKFYELSEGSTGCKRQNYRQRYGEATVEKRKFPLDAKGQPEARFPTRLGNLIDSYESYPAKRYGVNAIFHWYRIWLNLDKDLREELDNRQALADSSVYSSVAIFISGLLWIIYSRLEAIKPHFYPNNGLWVGIGFIVVSYVLYRASLYPQTQYGESFKSVFDVFEKQINVSRVVQQVADLTHSPEILNQDRQKQLQTAWRYLQNYTVKCPRPECSHRYPMSPEEFRNHYQEKHKIPVDTPPANPDFTSYRQNLKHAYEHEKGIRFLKISVVGLAVLLLVFRNSIWLAVLGMVVVLGLLGVEVWLRKRQKHYTDKTFFFENTFEFPKIYVDPDSNAEKVAQVLWPYVLVLLLAIVLFVRLVAA